MFAIRKIESISNIFRLINSFMKDFIFKGCLGSLMMIVCFYFLVLCEIMGEDWIFELIKFIFFIGGGTISLVGDLNLFIGKELRKIYFMKVLRNCM